jgi:glycosyltransferase involved in cell wall biosynthesis
MDVLTLTDYLGNVGGAEISTRTIVRGLTAHEAVDDVVVVGADRPDLDRLDFGDAEVEGVELSATTESLPDLIGDLVVERRLAAATEQYLERVDVVHAHHRRGALALARIDADVPTVSTIRDFWPICPISIYTVDDEQCSGCDNCLDDCMRYQGWDGASRFAVKPYLLTQRRHNRRGFAATDGVVFIADHLGETVTEAAAVPGDHRVIYNPVDAPDIDKQPSGRTTFVTASTLAREKGVETAVRAVARLDNATLDVFGDGPQRDDLEHLADALDCNDRVTFHGRVPPEDVYRAIAGATATIFPSLWAEPFGRVTVESMQLGTPVVGSAVGGIAEVIDDGENGLLFEPGDPDSLAEQLGTLLGGEAVLDTEATRRAGERFRPGPVVGAHVEFYRELIDSRIG